MLRRIRVTTAIVSAILLAPALYAELELGGTAPELKLKQWVQGEKFDLASAKGKNVVVVEFWATWCGPCRMTIPHLSKLQEKYQDKGVIIIGVSDEDADDSPVAAFVEKNKEKMTYRVAIDDARATKSAYFEPFNVRGIPHAFIIDKEGKLVWQGHPLGGMDEALADIVAGTYDISKAKRLELGRKQFVEYRKAASSAATSADDLRKLGDEMAKNLNDSAMSLNDVSWTILTDQSLVTRDVPLALKLAKRAVALTESQNAAILDTYARALFDSGEIDAAIEQQELAVKVADSDQMRSGLQQELERYRAAKK